MATNDKPNTIDTALLSMQEAIVDIASCVRDHVKTLSPDEYDFPTLMRGSKDAVMVVEKLLTLAPMLDFRNDFELAERLKTWLMSGQTDIVGDDRAKVFDAVTKYQERRISETSQLIPVTQYTLL